MQDWVHSCHITPDKSGCGLRLGKIGKLVIEAQQFGHDLGVIAVIPGLVPSRVASLPCCVCIAITPQFSGFDQYYHAEEEVEDIHYLRYWLQSDRNGPTDALFSLTYPKNFFLNNGCPIFLAVAPRPPRLAITWANRNPGVSWRLPSSKADDLQVRTNGIGCAGGTATLTWPDICSYATTN